MVAQRQLHTIEEFEAFISQPEQADRLFEYIGGEIVEKMPSSTYVSEIAMRIAFWIMHFLQQHGMDGHVTGEAGTYNVSGERYAPDVAFKRKPTTQEYPDPNPPELAVEVVSRSDQRADREERLQVKIGNYLAAGTLLWVVRPEEQTVYIYAPGQPVRILTIEDELDGGHVLPGFRLAVRAIFPEIEL